MTIRPHLAPAHRLLRRLLLIATVAVALPALATEQPGVAPCQVGDNRCCGNDVACDPQLAADVDVATTGTAAAAPFACLSRRGHLIKLSGRIKREYRKHSLPAGTRIDARRAVFLASPADHYPLSLGGRGGLCVAGGMIRGGYDRKLDWATMHDTNNAGVAFTNPDAIIDGIRIDDVTDGIRPRGTGSFTIREVHLSYIRDDCVEDDHLASGVIEDSLFDGCYTAISERPSPSISTDGRSGLLTVRGSLLRLEPMPGPRNGGASELGNSEFFKWSDRATKLALYDNVFMAEDVSQGGADQMGIPGPLVGCANNVMVWLGRGDYPAPLPSCFTVTKDRTRWDDAVAAWLRQHPHIAH